MNELIKITQVDWNGEMVDSVDARTLYKFLEIKTRFNDWISNAIRDFDFIPDVDFYTFTKKIVKPIIGRPAIEYTLKMDMAKELSMLARNEKGKQARLYFIECEKKSRGIIPARPESKLEWMLLAVEQEKELIATKQIAAEQKQIITKLQPLADYSSAILQSTSSLTTTQIAKDYGMSAIALNKFLSKQKVQFKQSGQWMVYQKYSNNGYVESDTYGYIRTNGNRGSKTTNKWTQKGRLFIHELLKKNGIIAVVEREKEFNLLNEEI